VYGLTPVAGFYMQDNTILLVEDCAEDASLVLASFKKWGVTNPVQVVPDGEEALEYLSGSGRFADRTRHPFPTLAILDLKLPRMSGFDVLKWVRTQNVMGNLPVVVLSGTKNMGDFDQAHQMGANACVVKSFDLGELYDLIQHLNYFSLASDYNSTSVEWSPDL
jgi:CheY-like chemotaxis protein